MKTSAVICPGCGASIKASAFQRQVRCEYCNTVVNVQADTAEGPSRMSLLERAFMFLHEGNFARADEYFERVLDIEPKTAMAYAGKLAAAFKVTSVSELRWSSKYLDTYVWFNKAKEYASKEELEELAEIEAAVKRRLDDIIAKAKADIDETDKAIAAKQNELDCLQPLYEKSKRKRVFYKVFKIIAIVFAAFTAVMAISVFTEDVTGGCINLFGICLPAVAFMIFCMVMQARWKKIFEGYTAVETEMDMLVLKRETQISEYTALKRSMR